MNDKCKIQVLCIDDFVLICSILKEIINSQLDMEVVGVVFDLIIVCDFIKQINLDVFMLDVEMLKMDGFDFLEKFMCLCLMLVVMIFLLIECGFEVMLCVLELGVVDFVVKFKLGMCDGMNEYVDQIVDKICMVVWVKLCLCMVVLVVVVVMFGLVIVFVFGVYVCVDYVLVILVFVCIYFFLMEKFIIVGVFIGGIEVIKDFLLEMLFDCLGIFIVQYMLVGFIMLFVKWLDGLCCICVKEVVYGECVLFGYVYIVLGDMYLLLGCSGVNYVIELDQGLLVNCYCLVVDVLFCFVVCNVGVNVLGVIFIGMGKDGVVGMLEMCNVGVYNVVQDEVFCVVYGMFKEVVVYGGVYEVLLLLQIGLYVLVKLLVYGCVMWV